MSHTFKKAMHRLARWSAIAMAAGAVMSVAAQDVGVTATEILIGEVQPMSGPASLIGKAGAAGSKLAIAEINANGGINGRKLRAIYEDDGYVPARSVVIPGSYTKKFPAGEYQVPCAIIIGQRKPSTDLKTSLNDALREYNVAV